MAQPIQNERERQKNIEPFCIHTINYALLRNRPSISSQNGIENGWISMTAHFFHAHLLSWFENWKRAPDLCVSALAGEYASL